MLEDGDVDRIFLEVLIKKITVDSRDNERQREYREVTAKEIDEIHAKGMSVVIPKDMSLGD